LGVTVVIGGQYGSEGKGRVAQFLALRDHAAAVVRVGGPNSGHTGISRAGTRIVLRQLPTAALSENADCMMGPGSYVDPELLFREIELTGIEPSRVLVDANAMVVSTVDREAEQAAELTSRIGSTASGTGAAVIRRIQRGEETALARDIASLAPYVGDTTAKLRALLDRGARVVVEGTQGFGLSLLHTPYYPYATSRDTSAAGAVSEAGLSPRDVDGIAMVIRAYPIRVAGNSGPLTDETTWEAVTLSSQSADRLEEFTSVTGRLRRIAEFDPEIVRRAIAVNSPTEIFLNHVDYVDAVCRTTGHFTPRARAFVTRTGRDIGWPIAYAGIGPESSFVDLRRPQTLAASS